MTTLDSANIVAERSKHLDDNVSYFGIRLGAKAWRLLIVFGLLDYASAFNLPAPHPSGKVPLILDGS
jgi:hypothetical protein